MQDLLQLLIDWYARYGYPVLFCGVLLENAGLPVPGETALLTASFMASPAGGGHFDLGWIMAVAFSAAILGDNGGYWLGRRLARPRFQQGKSFLFVTPQRYAWMESYFQRYGLWTVFFARFFAGFRVVSALSAGAAGMTWRRFFLSDGSGALVWAVSISLLGYYFGKSWNLVHHWLGWGSWIILIGILAVIGLRHLFRRAAVSRLRLSVRVTTRKR